MFLIQTTSEKLGKQAEAQLSEASNKIAELQKELSDFAAHKNRVQQENVELARRLEELTNQLDQASKAKLIFNKQLEEMKQAVDDETTVRNKVNNYYTNITSNYVTEYCMILHFTNCIMFQMCNDNSNSNLISNQKITLKKNINLFVEPSYVF